MLSFRRSGRRVLKNSESLVALKKEKLLAIERQLTVTLSGNELVLPEVESAYFTNGSKMWLYRETSILRESDRQTDRQTDRQADREIDRQTLCEQLPGLEDPQAAAMLSLRHSRSKAE